MDITFTKSSYYDRIKNYKKAIKKLKNLDENQCLTFGKKNRKDKYYQYYLNNKKIILKSNIGSKSKYGLIFLTTTDMTENIIFATKLMNVDNYNYVEVMLSKKLSNITLKNKSPHFLLVYKAFICNNKDMNTKLPLLIRKNNYYITINELADGNLKNFLVNIEDPLLILNAYQQILISILSFHYFTGGVYHRDCHYKNFLFHKIEKGGFFHYKIFNKDIYIENLGYIWMIWDFGLAKIEEYQKKDRLLDYFRINDFFRTSKSYSNADKFALIEKVVYRLLSLEYNYIHYIENNDFSLFNKILFNSEYNLFSKSYNKKSFIINKKPYTIKYI